MMGRIVLIVGMIGLGLVACEGTTTTTPGSARPPTSPTPSPITVTTAADCTGKSFALYQVTVVDNGRSYRMVPCQGLGVVLLHDAHDGCQWTGVETSDPKVMALVPLPLQPLQPGGTNEVYRSGESGTASLFAHLACAGGISTMPWSVTVNVTG